MKTFLGAPRVRQVFASIVAITGALVFLVRFEIPLTQVEILAAVAIVIGAVAIHFRSIAAQVLGRAVLWSNFVLGLLAARGASTNAEKTSILGLLIGCGVALLLAERTAFARGTSARELRPAAFAGTIELMMVLAVADAQTCLFLGSALKGTGNTELLFFVALAFVVGFIGLYRLATWGLVVTMSTVTVLLLAMLIGALPMGTVEVPLAFVFGMQILVPIPMLIALVTKRALPRPSPRLRRAAASGIIVVLLVGSTTTLLLRRPPTPPSEERIEEQWTTPSPADERR